METSIANRFQEITQYLKLSKSGLAKEIGVSHTMIGLILDGKSKPGFDVIESVLKCFPQINSDWLIKGEGEMLRNTFQTFPHTQDNDYLLLHLKQLETSFEKLSSQLEKKDEQIAGMQRTIDALVGKSKGVPSSQVVSQGIRTTPLQITQGAELGRVFKKFGS